MKILLICLLALSLVFAQENFSGDFKDICRDNGYPMEQEWVTTEDGYMLKMFRITGGLNKPAGSNNGNTPILLQHGILDSADCFVVHGQDLSPAFYLANQGYDVWLGNTRGNKYSREHKTLNPNKKEFWDFSFKEMAKDAKAQISHVLKDTKFEKVAYVGHSQGTTQFFVGMAEEPDWFAERVSVFIALGPVARLDHSKSHLLKMISTFKYAVVKAARLLGIHEMFPSNYLTRTGMTALCGNIPSLCLAGTALVASTYPLVDEKKAGGLYMSHFPSGTSLKALDHFAQVLNSKKF